MSKLMLPIQSILRNNRPTFVCSKRYQRTPFGYPKRTFKERNRVILDQHKNRRLELGELTGRPQQWKLPPKEISQVIKSKERKLPPLSETRLPYHNYPEEDIAKLESYGTYYDPLFNPHLEEERNKVNPDEEPFDAIYSGSKSQEYTGTRNITTPKLWEFVERLARIKIAPEPTRRKPNEPITALPSGFVPPPEVPPDLPYFIARTRNYLLPVYYRLGEEPDKCFTMIGRISGDLWKLEADLRNHLESLNNSKRRILTSVRETDGQVSFRGRHLHQVVDWLHSKGF